MTTISTDETVVVAQEPEPAPLRTAEGFTAEDIARARQEEKDKLYSSIQKQKEAFEATQAELKLLREARENEEAARLKATKEAEEAKKRAAEEEMSAKELIELREKELRQEFQQRLSEIEQQAELERTSFAKEKEFAALAEYARQQVALALANNEIAPELADLVDGNTQQEVDQSLATLKQKSEMILANIAAATQQQRATARGVSATGFTPTGPMDSNSAYKTYTPEEIAAMPMSEWKKLRPQLIGGAATNQNRGMYG